MGEGVVRRVSAASRLGLGRGRRVAADRPGAGLRARYRLPLAVAAGVAPGAVAAVWTLSRLATGEWQPGLVWLAVFAAATIAEAFPVPIEGVGPSTTSLATVFIAAAAAQLGPEASASTAALAILIAHARRKQGWLRRVYNVSLYCAAGWAAGLVALSVPESWRYGACAASAFYLVDVGLLTLVVAASSGTPLLPTAGTLFKTTLPPFVAMGSLTITLVALWKQGPVALALGPPLLLLVVLQRRNAAAREKQRELDRAKDEFLATTSHELRTPLASVYGAAQTLDQRRDLDAETRAQLMSVISEQSTRLSELDELAGDDQPGGSASHGLTVPVGLRVRLAAPATGIREPRATTREKEPAGRARGSTTTWKTIHAAASRDGCARASRSRSRRARAAARNARSRIRPGRGARGRSRGRSPHRERRNRTRRRRRPRR